MTRSILLLLLLCLAWSSLAQDDPPGCVDYGDFLRPLATVPTAGSARDVVVVGDRAYLADGQAGFSVLDVSEPVAPEVLYSDPDAGTCLWLTHHQGHVYVGNIDSQVWIYDVTGAMPVPVHVLTLDTGDALDFAVRDHLMVIAAGVGGLVILDVSTPAAPVVLGQIASASIARGVSIDDGLIAVANDGGGLWLLSFASPQQPQTLAQIPMPDAAYAVDLTDGIATVATWLAGVQIVDVTSPTSPELVATAYVPGLSRGLERRDDLVFLACSGLAVIDVALPHEPRIVGRLSATQDPIAVHLAGSIAYMTAGSAGLEVYDIDPPTSPRPFSETLVPGIAFGVATSGSYTLVGADELSIFDHSDPTAPVLVSTLDFTGSTSRVIAHDQRAYVSTAGTGTAFLVSVDITDPAAPVHIGTLDVEGFPSAMHAVGDYLYMADFLHSGLYVVDITGVPRLVGEVESPPFAQHLDGVTGHLVLGAGQFGIAQFQVFSLANPQSPQLVAELILPGRGINGLAVQGQYAYVSLKEADPNRVVIVDLADPADPVVVGEVPVPGGLHDLTVRGRFAYVPTFLGFVYVLDVSDPTAPFVVGETFLDDSAFVLVNSDRAVHAAATDLGLILLPLQCGGTVSVEDDPVVDEVPSPLATSLRAYPNPFNPQVTVAFALAQAGPVELAVFDVGGRRVAELTDRWYPAGEHGIIWTGRDHTGRALASGRYTARLVTPDRVATTSLVLVR